jgi:hypothetical protein
MKAHGMTSPHVRAGHSFRHELGGAVLLRLKSIQAARVANGKDDSG